MPNYLDYSSKFRIHLRPSDMTVTSLSANTSSEHVLYLWSNVWNKDGVDATELDVDFEAEVGEGLGACLVHVLGLKQ